MTFDEQMMQEYKYASNVIDKYAILTEIGYQKTVLSAMNYSVLAGGKRLRPILMHAAFEMCGGEGDVIEPFMAAIEMIHTYSLVHDDLPAMDNDMFRRGKETTHVKYGEDMAILTGDALLNRAFEVALKAFDDYTFAESKMRRVAKAMQILAHKAGIYGMVGGQTYDVEAENLGIQLDEESLNFIFELKTSALIEASMMIGAILGGADDNEVEVVEKIARNVGIAFQIQDDVLDVISTQEVLGKPIGSDEKNNKITYVTLKGIEESRRDVDKYSREAIELLESLQYFGR